MKRIKAFLKKAYSLHIVRYTSVGGINTIVIFGLFYIFNSLIGTGPIWANRIAYVGGLISNFTINKIWTFRSHHFSFREIILFLASWGVSYGVQFAVFRGLMDGLGWPEELAGVIAYPLYGWAFYLQCRHVAFNPKLGRKTTGSEEESPAEHSLEAG